MKATWSCMVVLHYCNNYIHTRNQDVNHGQQGTIQIKYDFGSGNPLVLMMWT